MNAYLKRLKAFLALGVWNIGFSVAPISDECVEISNLLFFDFLNLDKFLNILSTLLPTPTTSLSSALNIFGTESDDLVVFNMEVCDAAILLKSQIKCR